MAGYENHAGFSISGSKLQVVEVNYADDQFKLTAVDEASFDEQSDFENIFEDRFSALLQGAFDKLNLGSRLRSRYVSFSLPFELFHVAQIPFDNSLLYQDLIEEFRWEFSVLYPYLPVRDLVIQYLEVEKNQFNDFSTAIIFALERKYLHMLDSFCRHNHLHLRFVDHPHTASERSIPASSSPHYEGLTLSVYFNRNNLSVLFSFNSKPMSFKTIPLRDISEITDILLKQISGSPDVKSGMLKINTAFITGDAVSHSTVHTLNKALNLNFRIFNPFDKIRPVTDLYENKFYLEKYNSFASAAGIAYRLG